MVRRGIFERECVAAGRALTGRKEGAAKSNVLKGFVV